MAQQHEYDCQHFWENRGLKFTGGSTSYFILVARLSPFPVQVFAPLSTHEMAG